MKACPQELRVGVLAACDAGQPTKQVVNRFCVSPAWVRRLKQRRGETGEIEPRPAGGRRFGKIDPARLLVLWEQKKDRTLEKDRTLDEYVAALAKAGTHVLGQAVSRWLIKLGLRYKKRAWSRLSVTARTSPAVEGGGSDGRRRSTPRALSSWTRPACAACGPT